MADNKTKLGKALVQRGHSSVHKPSWRESLLRPGTVSGSKSIQAPDVIQGFSGSWAGSFALNNQVSDGGSTGGTPPQIQTSTNRLGLPGLAEINFRPYDYGTNRHGKYGPSLLGHPISFEIVGPTAKHSGLVHQWYLDQLANNDLLIIDSITYESTVGDPVALPIGVPRLQNIYGLTAMPAEGLYVVVTLTGAEGEVLDNGSAGTAGGIGDGFVGEDNTPPGAGPRTPIQAKGSHSKSEIFRVVAVGLDFITLDRGKRLADHFTFDASTTTPVIRAITLIKPAATRLVAVPGSGERGAEQVFAFAPPARSLLSEFQPRYNEWVTSGLVDPWTCGPNKAANPAWGGVGVAGDYLSGPALPVPTLLAYGSGRLQGINGEAFSEQPLGRMRLVVSANSAHFDEANDIGRVLHITSIRQINGGNWATAISDGPEHVGTPELDRLLGYYEIVATGTEWGPSVADYYDVRMLPQFDPETGVPFHGGGHLARMATGSAAGEEVALEWTLHEPVSTLWTKNYLHPLELEKARLQNIIDPNWAQPSLKGQAPHLTVAPASLPDKAIFNTSSSNSGVIGSNADPGSLMDLGFRVVLFPAKVAVGGLLVPDFDRPIEANEVVLDPLESDEQFVEVDYSAGLVHLSHPPKVGGDLITDAAIFTADNNPRKEVVFFASCVPFSREPGQMGANPRVTGARTFGREGSFREWGRDEAVDAYGARIFWPASNQVISSGPRQEIRLSTALSPIQLPATGFVEVLKGDRDPHGDPAFANSLGHRLSTFGYSSVVYVDADNGNNTTLTGTFGGADSDTPLTYNIVAGSTPATVVLRRDILTPNSVDGRPGTDYQFDTTYGFAKRASVLRLANATPQVESDGSMTLRVSDPRTDSHTELFKELFSSWVLSGGLMTTGLPSLNEGALRFSELVVLVQGVRSVLPAQRLLVNLGVGFGYVYINSADPYRPVYATTATLPLPTDQDVLIGRYTHDGIDVLTWVDLRQPLADVDKRLDVTVGSVVGFDQPGDAHFLQLADAIQFVAETMDPDSASGNGDFGKYRKIKVIGPTQEDNAKLPIAHPGLSGLIIEGAAWPTAHISQAITWSGVAPALFDLSGCSGWVFRDLIFQYDDDEEDPSDTASDRTLFTVTSGTAEICVFENILLHGPAHGFLYATGGDAVLESMQFHNCVAHDLTDFAIRSNASVLSVSNVLIRDCQFTVATSGSGDRQLDVTFVADTVRGILHLRGVSADSLTIQGSSLANGDAAVFSTAQRITIDGCNISGTDRHAIYLGTGSGWWEISNNRMLGIHTLAGGLGVKHCIYVEASLDNISVKHNEATLHDGDSTDYVFYAAKASTDACVVSGNEWQWNVRIVENYRFTDNLIVLGFLLVAGDNCVVRGNQLATGNLTYLVATSSCIVEGNHVAGQLDGGNGSNCRYAGNFFRTDAVDHIFGAGCTSIGDSFGVVPGAESAGGRVQVASDCIFTGCVFADGFTDNGSAVDNVRLDNCTIEMWTSIAFEGDHLQLSSNRFVKQANDLHMNIDGTNTVVTGNTFSSLAYLYLRDSGGAGRQEFVVQSNVFEIVGAGESPNRGGLIFDGHYSTVQGNTVNGQGALALNAAGDADTYSIYAAGDHSVVSGNICGYGVKIHRGDRVTCADNVLASGNLRLNLVSAPVTFPHVTNNKLMAGDINANSVPSCVISGNTAFIGGVGLGWVLNPGNNSVLQGNILENGFKVTANSVGLTVTGNRFGEITFTHVDAANVVFMGNRVLNGVSLSGKYHNFSHNIVGNDCDFMGCDDMIIMGNRIVGKLLVDAATDTAAMGGIIMGNRVALIGNGEDPEGTSPSEYMVLVGNKVDFTYDKGVQGSIFELTVVPPISVIEHNIKDNEDVN